jgi:hypothetical protein
MVLYKINGGLGFNLLKKNIMDLQVYHYLHDIKNNLLDGLSDINGQQITEKDLKKIEVSHKNSILDQINNTYYSYGDATKKSDMVTLIFDKKFIEDQKNFKDFVHDGINNMAADSIGKTLYKYNYFANNNKKNPEKILYDQEIEGGLEIKILVSKFSAIIGQINLTFQRNHYLHNPYGLLLTNRFLVQLPIKNIYGFLGFQWDCLLWSWGNLLRWGNKSYYYNQNNQQSTKDFDMTEGFRWTWILGLQFNKRKFFFYDYRWLCKFSFYISYQEVAYWMGKLLGFQWGQYRGYAPIKPTTIGLGLNCSL